MWYVYVYGIVLCGVVLWSCACGVRDVCEFPPTISTSTSDPPNIGLRPIPIYLRPSVYLMCMCMCACCAVMCRVYLILVRLYASFCALFTPGDMPTNLSVGFVLDTNTPFTLDYFYKGYHLFVSCDGTHSHFFMWYTFRTPSPCCCVIACGASD